MKKLAIMLVGLTTVSTAAFAEVHIDCKKNGVTIGQTKFNETHHLTFNYTSGMLYNNGSHFSGIEYSIRKVKPRPTLDAVTFGQRAEDQSCSGKEPAQAAECGKAAKAVDAKAPVAPPVEAPKNQKPAQQQQQGQVAQADQATQADQADEAQMEGFGGLPAIQSSPLDAIRVSFHHKVAGPLRSKSHKVTVSKGETGSIRHTSTMGDKYSCTVSYN